MKLEALTANFEGFHDLHFNDAASFIVAEREKESTKTDSRNGLGKSTTISLVDFCLGGQLSRQLEPTVGRAWRFSLALETRNGARLVVTRSPDNASEIEVIGDRERAGLRDPNVPDDQPLRLGTATWNRWLQSQSFPARGVAAETPTWRSLIRHFVRFKADTFIDPFRTVKNPGAEQLQKENAYLLGLDWSIPAEWASLRADVARLDALDVEGISLDDKIASVESRLAKAKSRAAGLELELSEFSIVPEYKTVEREANRNASSIKKLTNDIISAEQLVALYESRLDVETTTGQSRIAELYEEAGVVLADSVVRSLAEAQAFYVQVSTNRANYLRDEISRLNNDLGAKRTIRAELGARQGEVMQILNSGGALEDFAELQKRLAASQTEVSTYQLELEELGRVSARRVKLKSDEATLAARTRRDLSERFDRRSHILNRFAEILELLYGDEAELQISIGQRRSGLQLKMKLPKGGSDGVDKMAIFAYNIAISESFAKQSIGPGFLIHDSLLFADVDERQVAQALEIAVASAESFGYQYIAALNSDKIPWADLQAEETVRDNTVLILSDATPAGSLFGVRIKAEAAATLEVLVDDELAED
jgi:uncharacterized protein YydD (DUF2326 family)